MAALFGMHAPMTLGTRTLERSAEAAHALDTGFHVHVAEDEIDVKLTMDRYGRRIMDRMLDFGIPGPKSIFVHGVHFEQGEMDLLHSTGTMLVNNPESNMNNGLGVAPILEFLKHGVTVGVGTDGMSSHLISQARAMYLHQRTLHRDPTIAFSEACEILLYNNRDICNRLFHEPRGALAAGQLADIMIAEYVPFTPLNAETFFGHLLFGLSFSGYALPLRAAASSWMAAACHTWTKRPSVPAALSGRPESGRESHDQELLEALPHAGIA